MVNLSQSLRDPAQITGLWNHPSVNPKLLEARADKGFTQTLGRLGVTLLVTREYEHLVLALKPRQTTWMALPHPSGLLADRSTQTLHIACTRNPNLLMELRGETLLPARARFLPGSLYLHELALIGKKIYANAVGQNAIVSLDYTQGAKRVWWPAALDGKKRAFDKNYLQLNSIAAGKTLKTSFFSASSDRIKSKVPGDPKFPVDRQGVLFSAQTREPVAWGLTRPHSARLRAGELWVNNSGYGEVGRVRNGKLEPLISLGGWTRGLCFIQNVLFVGVSKVLPRFQAYAPGLELKKSWCGIAAVDPQSGRLLGRLVWPQGNQIFSIDWMRKARLPFGSGQNPHQTFYSFG
jgi:uncharacterized protein (TIGR03032 family)